MADETPTERPVPPVPGRATDSITVSDEATSFRRPAHADDAVSITDVVVIPQTAAVTAEAHGSVTFTGTGEATVVPVLTWETAARGHIQARLEEVVQLLDRSELLAILVGDDKITAEAIKDLLVSMTHVSETPDKSVVRGPLRWLGRKVDIFLDAAAKSSGKAVGPVAVAVLMAYLPPLHHALNELGTLAGQP